MEGIEQVTTFAPGLEGLDQQITLWINGNHCPWSDDFWMFMSGIKVWIPLYVIVAGLLVWRLGWKRGLIAIACIALAFFFNERVNNLIKAIVERVRPCNDLRMLAAGINVLEEGGGWSFPSGHACNSFGFAFGSALFMKLDRRYNWDWYSVFIVTWAVLVGISRVMVARHYACDVLVGGAIGSAMGILWFYVGNFIFKKFPKL